MKIEYYKSLICPRCIAVTRTLDDLVERHPEIEVETVEILAHPRRTFGAGVRQIPALRIGDDVRTWFLPNKDEVVSFVEDHLG